MTQSFEGLAPSAEEIFRTARRCLLPNENARFACHTQKGFLILSGRRLAFLRKESNMQYAVERVIPLDCFHGLSEERSDSISIFGIPLDDMGCLIPGNEHLRKFDVKAPKTERGEKKDDVRDYFLSAMRTLPKTLEEIRSSDHHHGKPPLVRDYSYLDNLPENLTHNAILDLNTILQDQPIHDELYQQARKYLGDAPFILEQSLRSAQQPENGVLFAAGKQGYIWVQGKKNGRYMQDILVDKVEWENIGGFIHQWHTDEMIIEAVYSLQKGREEVRVQYTWNPTKTTDSLDHLWLFQKLNGPWILADIVYKYSGKPLRASYLGYGQRIKPSHYTQRYYH